MTEKEKAEKTIKIINDIKENNITGYVELKNFYYNKKEYKKLEDIKNNRIALYAYIISRNKAKLSKH